MARKCCGQAEPGKTYTLVKPDGSKVVYSTRTEAIAAMSVAPGSQIIGPG
jgi:hypothetical protein